MGTWMWVEVRGHWPRGHSTPLLYGVAGPRACTLCALNPLTVGLVMQVVVISLIVQL